MKKSVRTIRRIFVEESEFFGGRWSYKLSQKKFHAFLSGTFMFIGSYNAMSLRDRAAYFDRGITTLKVSLNTRILPPPDFYSR
jgi:hypothetical protein